MLGRKTTTKAVGMRFVASSGGAPALAFRFELLSSHFLHFFSGEEIQLHHQQIMPAYLCLILRTSW